MKKSYFCLIQVLNYTALLQQVNDYVCYLEYWNMHPHLYKLKGYWLKTEQNLSATGEGGGGGSGSQHIAVIQPISEQELPYMIILLADWRCWHYELKRQNDTDCCCVPILLATFPPNLSGSYP